jgi:hypothetical protein
LHNEERVDNVEALTGDMEMVVGQIVKHMEMTQTMADSMVHQANVPAGECGEMSQVEWPMLSNPNSDLLQGLPTNSLQNQVPMYIPQKQDLLQEQGKIQLESKIFILTSPCPILSI